MADPIAAFFAELAARGHERQLEKVSGSLRIDVANGRKTESWLLNVSKGNLRVSRRNASADLVIRGNRQLLERIFTGKANALSSLLRGELSIDGGSELLVLFQRLLPRPKAASRMGVAAGYARHRT
jgi:predicted lipid carrier protein YhbT